MGRVLLVNFDETFEGQVMETLHRRGFLVSIYRRGERLAERLAKVGQEVDLVILDVSHDDQDTQDCFAEILQYRAQHGPRPMLLCASHVYRGPRFELALERKGARVVYVR